MGVDNNDFLKKRSKDEIKNIFEGIGISYKIGKFNGIYNRAIELEGS